MSGQDIKDALTKQIAEDLFPQWFEYKTIAHRLERAQDKRVELLKAEASHLHLHLPWSPMLTNTIAAFLD